MLYENDNYQVVLSNLNNEEKPYYIVNKVTNIVEFKTSLLPEALTLAYGLSARLDQFWEEEKQNQQSSAAIVPIPNKVFTLN